MTIDPNIPPSATRDFRAFMGELCALENIGFGQFFQGLPTTIRVNSLKAAAEEVLVELRAKGFALKPLESVPGAFEVENEPFSVAKTLPHILGWIYIQSVSSMLPALALDPRPGDYVLDIAAAPGSKTTQIAALVRNGAAICANDVSLDRLKSLAHNVDRSGAYCVGLSCERGDRVGRVLPETYTKVLVDAPCSALGIMNKSPDVMKWWNLREVAAFAARQKQLLVSGVKALVPGGVLVYSTCTLTPHENEEVISDIVSEYPVAVAELETILVPSRRGLTAFGGRQFDPSLARAMRFYPGESGTEGFFIAKLRKLDSMDLQSEIPAVTDHPELMDASDRRVRPILGFLDNEFEIPADSWDHFRFFFNLEEVWMTSDAWDGRPRGTVTRLGVKLARSQRGGRWKLSTNAAQVLGKQLGSRSVDLRSEEEVNTFLGGGMVRGDWTLEGAAVARWHGTVLGVGVLRDGVLKSQVPRGRRGEI